MNLVERLWIYQAERFLLLQHGLLIAAFSSSAVCISQLLRGQSGFPHLSTLIVAFICVFGFFLQLRISDEHKDAADDALYRPQRPVPRGLISLVELRRVGLVTMALQLLAVTSYCLPLLWLLLLVWFYLFLMWHEFGVKHWLRAHPVIYLISHMLVMPFIDLFATATDWLPSRGLPPLGLIWFILLSFFSGSVIEIGRKIKSPDQELVGVETYSALWGIRTALGVWSGALLATLICGYFTARIIHFVWPFIIVMGFLSLYVGYAIYQFSKIQDAKLARRIESMAGIWVLMIYLLLGLIAMGVHNL